MKKTKSDIVDHIARALQGAGLSTKTISDVSDAFMDAIKSTLTEGCEIELRGFGTFELRCRMPKKNARNPKTGSPVSVPMHTVVAFKSGKDLREAVWNMRVDAGDEQSAPDRASPDLSDANACSSPKNQ